MTTDPAPALHYLDARDYRLVVLVDLDGDVEIAHQHADDATGRDDMARLAAQIIDQLGRAAVIRHLKHISGITIQPPPAGRFVLGCRCGRAIDARDLRRRVTAVGGHGSAPSIDPITCARCSQT